MNTVSRCAVLVLLALAAAPIADAIVSLKWSEPPDQVPCNARHLCPDLVVDATRLAAWTDATRTFPPTDCAVVEGAVPAGTHSLVRFTLVAINAGARDLAIGRMSDHPSWFTGPTCHGSAHHRAFGDYRLWTPTAYAAWTAARAASPLATADETLAANPALAAGLVRGAALVHCLVDKAGPALVGGKVLDGVKPARYSSCTTGQGISVAWGAESHFAEDGQWIVVDDVPPGAYVLEVEVNAARVIRERDYANNVATVGVAVA